LVELHRLRIEQNKASGFGTRQVQRSLQDVIHDVHDARIRGAHNREVLLAEFLLNAAPALGQKRTAGAGERDAGIVVVGGAGGVDGHQLVQAGTQLRIVAALVSLVRVFIDVDDPTNAAGVLAIGADAAKGVVGPRLEPSYRLRH
jgi:hypothetical protein